MKLDVKVAGQCGALFFIEMPPGPPPHPF